jgi:transforming growth factor-beta-induced protein
VNGSQTTIPFRKIKPAMMRLSATALTVLFSSAGPFVLSQSTLATVISSRNDLSSFTEILDASGLAADLFRSAGFQGTVFVPNDDAFGEFAASNFSMLVDSEWAEHTACFVSYHTVEGTFLSNSLEEGMNLTTLDGDTLVVSLNLTRVDEATIIEADIVASNGVVHIVDTDLTPACVAENIVEMLMAGDDFSILLQLLDLAGLSDVLATSAPITLFAPPNAAWEKRGDIFIQNLSDPQNLNVLKAFLMNHVVNGNWYSSRLVSDESFTLETTLETTAFFYNESSVIFMNYAEVVDTDMLASNGVIHTMDTVVILASLGDILMSSQVASDSISFSNFTAALMQANFLDALFLDSLNNPRTTTVFAPDDNAFAQVSTEVLDKLLDPNWSFHLRELLRYHLVDGTLRSDALAELNMVTTLADVNLTITSQGSGLTVEDANVIYPDLAAYNGVLHGIDELLFPPSLTVTVMDQLSANPQFTTFLGLLEASETLTGLVQGSGPVTLFIPTNAAFELFNLAVDSSQFESNETEMILQYHLVESNVFLNALPDGTTITTLNGQDVVVSVINATEEDVRSINTAQVLHGGIASNGVIYVLDQVLLPELPSVNPAVSLAPAPPSAAPVSSGSTTAAEPGNTSTSSALRLPVSSRVFCGVTILLGFLY